MQCRLSLLMLVVLLTGLLPAKVSAHAVGVDCTLRLGKLEIEVFYDDDSPAQKAKVQLVNAREEIVASAVTDERGRCVLRKPIPGKYEVRVDAGAGHRAKKKIDVPASTLYEAGIGVALDVSLHAADAPPSAEEIKTIDSPTRAEFTRWPWEKALIGFVLIAGLSGAFLLGSRKWRAEPR